MNLQKIINQQVELTRFLLPLGYTPTPFSPQDGVSLSVARQLSVTTHALLSELVHLEMLHTTGKPESLRSCYPSYVPQSSEGGPCLRLVLAWALNALRAMHGERPEAPAILDRLAGPPTAPAILDRLTVPPTWTGKDWAHFQGLAGGKHPYGALYVSGLVPVSYTVGRSVAYHKEGPHNRLGRFVMDFGKVMRATEDEQGRPESDSTHTVILALAALDLARQVVANDASAAAEFSPQRVFALALVHDLVETYAGDVSTLQALSAEDQKAKEERECEALGRIIREMSDCTWMISAITEYEAQTSVEAIFVRLLDKATPLWTQEINGCAVPRKMGMTPEELDYEHRRRFSRLRWDLSSHPALRVAGMVLQASGQRAVESYGFRSPVPAYRRDVDADGD